MEEKKPLILVTNDDGFEAQGIREMTSALRALGDVVVFAPEKSQSGMSSAITTRRSIKYRKIVEDAGLTVFICDGTPVDCVKLAVNRELERKPDLLVSGINHGGNQSISVHYSGTVGAALEGCIQGIPSFGISMYKYDSNADFFEACITCVTVAKAILKYGLPAGTFLNINIPNVEKIKGVKPAHQAEGIWVEEFKKETTLAGKPRYWLGGNFQPSENDVKKSDVSFLDAGYATIVPCTVNITDKHFLKKFATQLPLFTQTP